MATITKTLTITSSDVLTDSLNISLTKDVTVAGNVRLQQITTSNSATAIDALTDDVGRSIVYMKNLDSTIDIKIFTDADNGNDADADEEILDIKPGEFALFPWAGIQALYVQSDSGTPVLEFGLFAIA